MSSPAAVFLKKALLGKTSNLLSLEDPFARMQILLRGVTVTGILDAGASHGRISRKLLRRFPHAHVFAFEPNERYLPALQQYANAEARFHPHFVALSDGKGRACLNITKSPGSTSLLTPGRQMRESFQEESHVEVRREVDVTTIDDWIQSNGHPTLQLLKFDIQGAELKALRGAVRTLDTSVALIYIELWFNPGYEGGALYSEVDLFLRAHGFLLCDLYKPRYDARGVIMWTNAIFIHPGRVKG
jgi:FkbM family methyltransferase